MAARTSGGTGTLVTITILGILALGLFITSILFFAQRRTALNNLALNQQTTQKIATEANLADPLVAQLRGLADGKRQSLVAYMADERRQIMQKVMGSDRSTIDDLDRLLENQKIETNVAAALRDKTSQIASLTTRVSDAEAARDRALADKESESKRVRDIETGQQETVKALSTEVARYKAETDTMREQLQGFRTLNEERMDRISGDYSTKETELRAEIEKLQSERAVSLDRIKTLELQVRGQRFAGQSEYALVDGEVVSINAADKSVTISIGRRDKVVLGMSFEIYAQGASIRPEEGATEFPRGKASVEVVRVDDASAVARIIREQKGNPIVRGDSIANAVYDPTKQYKFLVYGNFDTFGGGATPQGAGEIKAWIQQWGGTVVDDLTGDVDFIVLGTRPTLPPEPNSRAPFEVVQEYIRLQRLAKRYDELFNQAVASNIPVLNQNRLRTLIGK